MVARLVRDEEAAGSNPVSPTEGSPTGSPRTCVRGLSLAFVRIRAARDDISRRSSPNWRSFYPRSDARQLYSPYSRAYRFVGTCLQGAEMRLSTRLVVAGIMSVLSLGLVPAAVATGTVSPSMAVHCCR